MGYKDRQEALVAGAEQPRVSVGAGQPVTLKFGDAMTGTLVGFAPDGMALVDYPGNPALVHLTARSCVALALKDAGREIVLLFDGGDPAQPIVVGLIQPAAAAINAAGRVELLAATAPREVELDGENIELTAKETITLRCGDASITLNRDGKIVIRGMHVVSHAAGVNRIRGGSVQLN